MLYPYALQLSNLYRIEDALCPVLVPDVETHDIPQGVDFSMCAGDFLEVYRDESGGCYAGCWTRYPESHVRRDVIHRKMEIWAVYACYL